MDVSVEFCDSGSNRSRDIRLPHFVRTTTMTTQADRPYDNRAKRRLYSCVLPKNHFMTAAATNIDDSIKRKLLTKVGDLDVDFKMTSKL